MNRLWVRLSLAFSAVVVISFLTVSLISTTIIRANVAELNELRESRVDQPITGIAPDQVGADKDLTPVVVDGKTVAYLDFPHEYPSPAPRIFPFIDWQEILLVFAVVGGVICVLFGVLMSRNLAAPLNALALAADEIGAGHWDHRVKVAGTREVRSLGQSFNKMIDQLQHNENLRRNLVADVAHELRTPITALQANIYAILDDAYPMTKTEIAGLYDQIRMLSRLVKDLHELSQAESGQLPLDRQPFSFSDTLEELISPFYSVSESKGVRLEVDVPPNLPLVSADEERINQVMHNLLNNALRYTPIGAKITVRVRSENGWVTIEVQDTGEGISAEHLPNVFERFYRADYGRSRQRGGMGLGLAITKAIVEAHNGTISVSSTGVPGEGTTFCVRLPALAEVKLPHPQPA